LNRGIAEKSLSEKKCAIESLQWVEEDLPMDGGEETLNSLSIGGK